MYSANDHLYPSVSSRKLPFKNMSFFVFLVYLILLFNYQWSSEICSFNISWWSMLAADFKWFQNIWIRTHWIIFYNVCRHILIQRTSLSNVHIIAYWLWKIFFMHKAGRWCFWIAILIKMNFPLERKKYYVKHNVLFGLHFKWICHSHMTMIQYVAQTWLIFFLPCVCSFCIMYLIKTYSRNNMNICY